MKRSTILRHVVRFAAASVAAITLGAASAQAQPISFYFRGTAAGSLGTTDFRSAAFTIRLDADYSNITTPYGPIVPRIEGLTGQGTVAGLGSFTFSNPLFVFVSHNPNDLAAGVGEGGIDLFTVGPIAALATYGLDAPFAQAAGNTLELTFNNVNTSIGLLSFDRVTGGSFEAVTGVSAVPEPATYALVASGLVVMAGVARRRSRG